MPLVLLNGIKELPISNLCVQVEGKNSCKLFTLKIINLKSLHFNY